MEVDFIAITDLAAILASLQTKEDEFETKDVDSSHAKSECMSEEALVGTAQLLERPQAMSRWATPELRLKCGGASTLGHFLNLNFKMLGV